MVPPTSSVVSSESTSSVLVEIPCQEEFPASPPFFFSAIPPSMVFDERLIEEFGEELFDGPSEGPYEEADEKSSAKCSEKPSKKKAKKKKGGASGSACGKGSSWGAGGGDEARSSCGCDGEVPRNMHGNASRSTGGKSIPRGKRNKELGARGEDAVASFLESKGYDVIERNWTCAAGEADIIALDGNCLVFVEVKTRSGVDKGFPAEAVDKAKRKKYERIALSYVQKHFFAEAVVRFDVISLVIMTADRAMLRHHVGAFSMG